MTDAAFETLRKYMTEAVEQLTREMAGQQTDYCVPSDDVVALIRSVAAAQDTSIWQTWESWALRHAIPVHRIVRHAIMLDDELPPSDLAIMEKRLRDLLGYAILGLVMAKSMKPKSQ